MIRHEPRLISDLSDMIGEPPPPTTAAPAKLRSTSTRRQPYSTRCGTLPARLTKPSQAQRLKYSLRRPPVAAPAPSEPVDLQGI
jgi:hypothetical protein